MDSSKDIRQLASSNESEIVEASHPVKIVPKGWGEERWLVNIPSYCAKILKLNAGLRLSWHYHEIKEETFIVLSGECYVIYGTDPRIEQANTLLLTEGSRFHIPRRLIHQLLAITDCEILEVSTTHHESDSYRITKGD